MTPEKNGSSVKIPKWIVILVVTTVMGVMSTFVTKGYNAIRLAQTEMKKDLLLDIGELKTEIKELRDKLGGGDLWNTTQDGKIEANKKSIERLGGN